MAARGPADPARRDRIIAAVIDVVAERGLAAVTHRSVAEAAGVPLGSTTYYFDSLDDLLAGALEKVVDDYDTQLRDWAKELQGATGRTLAEAVTELCFDYLDDLNRCRAEYALYLAAMDRPALRPLAASYHTCTTEVFATLLPHDSAVALTAAMDGLFIRALASPNPPARAEVEAAIAVICG